MNRFLSLAVVLALPGKYHAMMRPKSEAMAVRLPRSSVVCAAALAAALIAAGTPARASFVVSSGYDESPTKPYSATNSGMARSMFLSALASTGVGVENFDSPTPGPYPPTLTFTSPTSGSTVTTAGFSAASGSNTTVTSGTPGGAFATSGTQFLYESSGTLDDTVTFTKPVAGVGLYLTDLADGGGSDQIKLVLTLNTNPTMTMTETLSEGKNVNLGNGNLIFFGVVSTDPTQMISSVEIENTVPGSNDAIGIDDLTIGTNAVVPEPASVVMLGIGVLGVAVGQVRRGRNWSRPA